MKVKTSELTGAELDWAVAEAIGGDPILHMTSGTAFVERNGSVFSPSSDWGQLGEIINTVEIVIGNHPSGEGDNKFWGSAHSFKSGTSFQTWDGAAIAACRAIVASVHGDEIDLPEGLQ
ncbi:MAG: phage protein NinX family protein [Symbiopectobacterium sp.]|uniref:phage protein NinX family protein n=1 Tax=Symbiopectobacterium sp. TaxID=2952789 RepID=UPI0039EC7441